MRFLLALLAVVCLMALPYAAAVSVMPHDPAPDVPVLVSEPPPVHVDWSDAVLLYHARTPDLDPAPPPTLPKEMRMRLRNPNTATPRNTPLKFPLQWDSGVIL
jgi:hypothetical protein